MKPHSGPTWLSIAQFVISALTLGVCWLIAAGIGASVLLNQTGSASILGLGSLLGPQAVSLLVIGSLFIPSVVTSLADLSGRPFRARPPRVGVWRWLPTAATFAAWLAAIALGYQFAVDPGFARLGLPLLTVLAIGAPILLWVWIGRRRLPAGSPQRSWGLFNAGLLSGPLLAIPIEIALLLLAVLGIVLWLMANPQGAAGLQELSRRLLFMQNDLPTIERTLRPLLEQPGVIFGILAGLCGLAPLVEEAVKPVGVWVLSRRALTPQEGFVSGLLCGAGFAFFESLNIIVSDTSGDWYFLALVRAGTSLLHITTTALVGYGLASAWKDRRFFRLGAVFLAAVALHGAWNALSLGVGYNTLFSSLPAEGSLQSILGASAPWGLGALVILLLAILVSMNARLRRASPEPNSNPQSSNL